MQVKMNAFRGEARPGDIVDVDDADGATLIDHGAAFPVDDVDAEPEQPEGSARTVRGEASLQASSSAATDQAPPA